MTVRVEGKRNSSTICGMGDDTEPDPTEMLLAKYLEKFQREEDRQNEIARRWPNWWHKERVAYVKYLDAELAGGRTPLAYRHWLATMSQEELDRLTGRIP